MNDTPLQTRSIHMIYLYPSATNIYSLQRGFIFVMKGWKQACEWKFCRRSRLIIINSCRCTEALMMKLVTSHFAEWIVIQVGYTNHLVNRSLIRMLPWHTREPSVLLGCHIVCVYTYTCYTKSSSPHMSQKFTYFVYYV